MFGDLEESYAELSSGQKVAHLLIALGQKWATEIMRALREDEVRRISYWINQTRFVSQPFTERVIRDFYGRMIRKSSLGSSGGREYLLDVLIGLMGEDKATVLIDDLIQQEKEETFRVLKRIDPKQLAAYLKQEHPQTVALMMAYIDPNTAAAIIAVLPDDFQVDVMIRLAKMQETDPDIVETMEKSLNESLGSVAAGKMMKTVGGPKAVAEILNNIDRIKEKEILEDITERDFDLATEIKELMFVFDDFVLLDDKSIQKVLKKVEQDDLVLALKGANNEVKERIFRNISKRQVDMIKDELAFMGPVKASVVTVAQQKIVNTIRKLDEEGQILIQGKGGGGDEIFS